MKRSLVIAIAVIIGIVLLAQPSVFSTLFGLLFLGFIPGTTLSVPPLIMLLGFLAALYFMVRWTIEKQLYPGSPQVRSKSAQARGKTTTTRKVPKRVVKKDHKKYKTTQYHRSRARKAAA